MPIQIHSSEILSETVTPPGRVPVVIVTYRNCDDALACLETLASSAHTAFEVHICENGGSEAYDRLKAVFPDARPAFATALGELAETSCAELPGGQPVFLHLARGNLGYAGGINAVLDRLASETDWLAAWILNPDTTIEPGALAALLARARSGGYGLVGSRIVREGTDRIHLYGGKWRKLMARGLNLGLGEHRDTVPDIPQIEREMDYVCGAAMLVSHDFIEEVGLMDERYFLYCEEVDWCMRRGKRRLGYAHDSIVYHGHGTTTGASNNHAERSELSVYLGERNKLLLTRRFFPRLYPVVAFSTLLLATQYLMKRSASNFRAAIVGWAAGLRGEEGILRRFRRSHGGPADQSDRSNYRADLAVNG